MARPSASLMRSVRELGAKAPHLPDLLALSDEARAPHPLATLEGLPAGSGYIFRHYSLARAERTKLAKKQGTPRAGAASSFSWRVISVLPRICAPTACICPNGR